MANDYSFFSQLKITDSGRTRTPKVLQPTGMTLRVLSDGRVYPSNELIKKFNLEFTNAVNPDQGNGIDIVDTAMWKVMAEVPRMLMFGITPKGEGKVDLFSSVRRDEDGEPKSSVTNRGEKSEFLLSLVKEFNWLTEEQKYVDLVVITDHPFRTTDGIAYIPKVIEKGDRAGERDYKRRDNVTFYPVEMVVTQVTALPKEVQNQVTI